MTKTEKLSTQSVEFDADIAIVGAGMVGITAALLLAKACPELRITLLDQYPLEPKQTAFQPSFDQRATAIAVGSIEALAQLQLEKSLLPVSGKISTVHVSDKGHWAGSQFSAHNLGVNYLGLVVPNAALGESLMAQLVQSNVKRMAPVNVARVNAVSGGYEVSTDQQALKVRLLILADGASDTLKKQLGIASKHADYQQRAVIANVRVQYAHQGVAYERFTANGPMAMLPLADAHSVAMVWTLADKETHIGELPDKEFLQQAQKRFGDRLGNFLAVSKRDVYPLALVEAAEQVRAHLVLLGNAAHFLHPVAGQGFNLSVRDIAALVAAIESSVKRDGVESLGKLSDLMRYQTLRTSDQWLTTQYSHQLVKWFSSDHWLNFLPRQAALQLVELLPPVKRWLATLSMGRN